MTEYTVQHHPHGTFIKGPCPVPDLLALMEAAKEKGYTIVDAGLGTALGGGFALTSEEGAKLWRAEVEQRIEGLSAVDRWRRGCDTGMSSCHLLALLTGDKGVEPALPHDASDFGRCVRMLDATGLRDRLGEVRDRAWRPFIEAWDELESLYRKEELRPLYLRLRALRGER